MEFMESEKAAYKIYNRATGIRGYFPLKNALMKTALQAPWLVRDIHSKKTVIDAEKIHTIAVTCKRF
jgi:hypothetical protein